ncbi:hypothetical protein [Falsiroseomonas sp. CW058]|uniref:hypothetical protein n=1 Tax=Falsiroseomonas sp. CW058 TaxID=3388664 RepID=UPI003D312DD1
MRPAALALLPLLAACAQAPPPVDTSWVGRSEAELVAGLGVPNRVYEAEGRRVLAYDGPAVASGPVVTPSIGLGVGRWSGGWGSGVGFGTGLGLGFGSGAATAAPCPTNYELRDGRVIGVTRQGAGCG